MLSVSGGSNVERYGFRPFSGRFMTTPAQQDPNLYAQTGRMWHLCGSGSELSAGTPPTSAPGGTVRPLMHDQTAGKCDRSPHGEPTDIGSAVEGEGGDEPSDGIPTDTPYRKSAKGFTTWFLQDDDDQPATGALMCSHWPLVSSSSEGEKSCQHTG